MGTERPPEPDDAGRMFEPFVRLHEQRTGSRGVGLGLAIVRAVATAHGAIVTATPRREGGLEVTVAFPQPARGRRSPDPGWNRPQPLRNCP